MAEFDELSGLAVATGALLRAERTIFSAALADHLPQPDRAAAATLYTLYGQRLTPFLQKGEPTPPVPEAGKHQNGARLALICSPDEQRTLRQSTDDSLAATASQPGDTPTEYPWNTAVEKVTQNMGCSGSCSQGAGRGDGGGTAGGAEAGGPAGGLRGAQAAPEARAPRRGQPLGCADLLSTRAHPPLLRRPLLCWKQP